YSQRPLMNRGVVLAVSLIALAIWDTVLLWCAFFYYAIRKLPIAINSDWLNILMPWFHPFSQIANTAATWCVVAITWQRFMATRDPFRTPRSAALVQSFRSERRISFMYCSTYRRLLRMPIALSIGAVLLNIPAFFELYNYMCYKLEENRIAISGWERPLGPFWYNKTTLKVRWYRCSQFPLDLVEVTVGDYNYYLVDVSNFLVILNSATNSLVFLKASSWLNNRLVERKTMRRKKTVCDAGQLLGDRLSILSSTWQQALTLNDNNPGMRILYSILRRQPTLFAVFRAPNLMLITNDKVSQIEPEQIPSLFANGNARNFDLLSNTKYVEVAQRITTFMGELIKMMKDGKPEEYIVMRIRRVGAIHFQHGIPFPSAVWREYKSSTIAIISECEFKSNDVICTAEFKRFTVDNFDLEDEQCPYDL
ncbi:hypothetical protein TELCIR_13554, partial [Teladorsagia circumcincta]